MKAGEEILCAILYIENSDKSRFSNLKKRVENDYVMKKSEYPRTAAEVYNILLYYQHNYKYNSNSQSNGVRNQLMFAQYGKNGDGKGDRKEKKRRPRRNLDHITCNYCGEKGQYFGNSECSTQINLKEDVEEFRKKKQEKSANKPLGGGDQKLLVNSKDALCSVMMVSPTEEWGEPQSPGLMF